jgi:hypothetical protein
MRASLCFWLAGACRSHKHGIGLIHRERAPAPAITILQRRVPIRASIATVNAGGTRFKNTAEKGWAMTEQNDRLARAREEIAARVASFKATQEKFERERQEYFVTTLKNAQNGSDGKASWS